MSLNLASLVGLHTLSGWGAFSVGVDSSASDWIINDIRIGNRSAFAEAGQIPGDVFAIGAIDTLLNLPTVQVAQDLTMEVTYNGRLVEGAAFRGQVIGTSDAGEPHAQALLNNWYNIVGGALNPLAPPPQRTQREILPLSSGSVIIPPGQTAQIVARPLRAAFRPERIMIAGSSKTEHLLLRLDGELHDFMKGGTVKRPDYAEADDLAKEEAELDEPLVLAFYTYGAGPMLYAIDERSGEVVLEAGSIVRIEEVTRYDWVDDENGDAQNEDPQIYDEDGEPIYGERIERVEQVERRDHFLRFDPAGFLPDWWAAYEATSQRDSGDSETISASMTESDG
jgi:hypothetical protein